MLMKLLATAAITAMLSAGGTFYMRSGVLASLLGHLQAGNALQLRATGTGTTDASGGAGTRASAKADLQAGAQAQDATVSSSTSGTVQGHGVLVVPAVVTSYSGGGLTVQPISAAAWLNAGLSGNMSLSLPVTLSLSGVLGVSGTLIAGQHVLLHVQNGAVVSVQAQD